MKATLPATASCSPTGRPHCSRDHSRAIFRHHLADPAHTAGSDSRPTFRLAHAAPGRRRLLALVRYERRPPKRHAVDVVPAILTVDHLLASAAIPVLFPPVYLKD
ncbi:MAG: hypothetical protein QOC67_1417 [Pseudonocardiales bacterium]|nr:hypothetical protein [Pseudonocardiales bacterium]MDT7772493.1 hypothetical protein [Pseudonocardiales bacterium]